MTRNVTYMVYLVTYSSFGGFLCEILSSIYLKTSSHTDYTQKASPLCEASCGSATAMILRMFSHTLCIESSCSESEDALLVLACLHTFCHTDGTAWLFQMSGLCGFVCVAIG